MGCGETRGPDVTAIPFAAQGSMRWHQVLRRTILVAVILGLLALPFVGLVQGLRTTDSAAPGAESPALILHVARTGPAEASVLGVALTLNDTIELLVDGVPVANTTPVWNLDYWFLHVPVSDNSTVQIRIGLVTSPVTGVPPYAPQAVGPPGFVYADGARLMLNGSPIQLFGMNEQTSFLFALIASGLYGWDNPAQYWGQNHLFPSDRNGTLANVSSADDLWREFFRYILHYQNISSEPSSPRPNLLRIWIIDEGFGVDKAWAAWKANASAFWGIFDRLVYWADRAGIYLVPVLGHQGPTRENALYNVSSTLYAHHLELVRAIVARYDDNPRIAMWDLWNEPDVNNDAYWASVGGIGGFRAWASRYLADVKAYSPNHLLTLGIGGWTLFPGVPGFGWQYHVFWSDIPGLEVSQHHAYGTAEDQYLVDWETAWHEASAIPHYESEVGYNLDTGPNPYGYGYWPWFTERTRAAGWPALCTMLLSDNGKGPYADYPYNGTLPDYPAAPPPPQDREPVAAFTFSPVAPVKSQRVTFNASIASDDFGIVNYTWSFGGKGASYGMMAERVFGSPGDVPVTLTVTDTAGQKGNVTVVVHLSAKAAQAATFVPNRAGLFALGAAIALPAPACIFRSGRRRVGAHPPEKLADTRGLMRKGS